MINIKQSDKNDYLVSLTGTRIINKESGRKILTEIAPLLEKHAVITIDLDDVIKIDSDGYADLTEIMKVSDSKNSDVHFTNINEDLNELIENLTLTSES